MATSEIDHDSPLTVAIRGLLDAGGSDAYWAEVLGCSQEDLTAIRYGVTPTDAMMNAILTKVEGMMDGAAGDLAAQAHYAFSSVIRKIRAGKMVHPFGELNDLALQTRLDAFIGTTS